MMKHRFFYFPNSCMFKGHIINIWRQPYINNLERRKIFDLKDFNIKNIFTVEKINILKYNKRVKPDIVEVA